MLSCLAVSVVQGNMRTYSMEAVPTPKFFSIAERFVSYVHQERNTNLWRCNAGDTLPDRQAPGGKLSETLNINLVKTNTNLKPWKAT